MQIRERRLAHGWSQEELATVSGLSVRTIQRIETGQKPGLETLKSLAAAFETDVEALRGEDILREKAGTPLHTGNEGDENRRGLQLHLWVFVILMPALTALNWLVSPRDWWVIWVAVFWTVGVVLHVLTVRIMFPERR